jgi:hypothetical protein
MTQPISFLYSIKLIEPKDGLQARYSSEVPRARLPPVTTTSFEVLDSGDWRRWSPGNVREVPQDETSTISVYSTVSLVWCHDLQAFLQVPYDCTETNVKGAVRAGVPVEWDELSFHYGSNQQGRCLALLGYKYARNKLHAYGSPTWMPQLLPARYQCPGTSQHQGSCRLAGELSILLGLVAFSTTPDLMHWAIENCFYNNPTSLWIPHNQADSSKSSFPKHTHRDCIRGSNTSQEETNADSWSELAFSHLMMPPENVSERGKEATTVRLYHETCCFQSAAQSPLRLCTFVLLQTHIFPPFSSPFRSALEMIRRLNECFFKSPMYPKRLVDEPCLSLPILPLCSTILCCCI